MVHANADGAAEALGFLHKRRKGFGHLFLAFIESLVRLLVKRQNSSIDKVTRIDADFFDPLKGFESGLGLEVDVGRNRNLATGGSHLLHDFFKTLSVCKCRSGNTDESATHLGKCQRFSHGTLNVLRLGGCHGLN